MAKIFTCTLTRAYTFTLKADNREDAAFWLQTHDLQDVENATSAFDVECSEEIIGTEGNSEYAIDISTEEV